MTMLRRLAGIRGRLLLWYLGILTVLLLGVGSFLFISLANYVHTTSIQSLQDTARSEMALLGPCYIRSSADLRQNAQKLANLLGSREVAVKIVTPAGVSLADHVAGAPGAGQPLRLSATTIRNLLQSAQSGLQVQALRIATPKCLQPPLRNVPPRVYRGRLTPRRAALQSGDLALVAVPLGPPGDALGYAILGRSMAPADDTVRQARVVFVLGAFVALLVALLAALPIINRALRPLNRVARTAEAIAAGDLEKRANLAQSPDEIGRLGRSFDRMVDRLQAALSAATESEERMRRFLADASHELRTPLTALRGTSEVLLRQGTTGNTEADRALRAMHEESVRLSRLVDDLLTLSRLDAGQALEPQPVMVGEFLQRFVDRYASIWPNRSIRVDTETVDGARAFVDPDALTRALTNLVDNAARYSSPPGSITLSAGADARNVKVRVEDEGPGLDPEDAGRIFERFYRGAKSRSRSSGGTGLGLAIVDAMVRQSGGNIQVDTGPDRGTIITMTFPRPAS